MTDSRYPTELDTDRELPRVDDNITEIGGEAINGLRDAVFNIEETLGLDPQGTTADLNTRLDESLNPDGSLKASALSTVGLVTLPITNSMIASNANIEEGGGSPNYKLALNYPTVTLKDWINENRAQLDYTIIRLNTDISNLNNHVSHPATYGRHRTSDVDGYSGTQYDGYNLQGIVGDLDARIISHITGLVDRHAASQVSFDDTETTIVADNVQNAIKEVDHLTQGAVYIHQDNQHDNGILKAQEAFYDGTNHSSPLTSSSALYAIGEGATSVQFISIPAGFGEISRGDRLDITVGSVIYTRYVDSTNATQGIINFYKPFPTSTSVGYGIVYKNSSESLAPSSANFGIRQHEITEQGGSVIQMVHQDSPFILSSGIDVRGINNSAAKYLKIGWSANNTGDIDIYTLMVAYNPLPSTWTVENLSIVLNKEFRQHIGENHFPLVTFVYGGELGIAIDEPNGYLTILAPTAPSAWTTLGFSENEVAYPLSRKLYVDGYDYDHIRKAVSGTATVSAGDLNVITSISTNIKTAGVKAPGLIRVSNAAASNDNGTFLFTQVNSSVAVTVDEHDFTAGSFDVEIYSDVFAVATVPSKRTLYELFMDGYYDDDSTIAGAEFRGAERVEYYRTTGSPQDIAGYFDVTDISRSFVESERRIIYNVSGTTVTMALGTRGSGLTLTLSGPIFTLPIAAATIPGYNFRLIDYNGVDYIEIQVALDYTILATGNALDIDVYNKPDEERYLQVGKVLHNRQFFKHLSDRRLFGTVGRKNVRDDFTRDYTSYPRSVLRGSGITYGFNVDSSVIGTSDVVVEGGESLTNGSLYNNAKRTFTVPVDGVSSVYNLFIDETGILRLWKNDQFVDPFISAPSVEEIIASSDKTILWQITVNASNVITAIADYRKYINNLDNKIELIVEENTMTHGSFASLRSAINYLNGSDSAAPRIIKIYGEVDCDVSDGPLVLPGNTTIQGDTNGFSSDSTSGARIAVSGTGTTFIQPESGCSFRNLAFDVSASATMNIFIGSASSIDGIAIKDCIFNVATSTSIDLFIGSSGGSVSDCFIKDCSLEMVAGGSITQFFGATGNFSVSNVIMENVSLNNMTSSAGYVTVMGSGGLIANGRGLLDVTLTNCDFVFADTDSDNLVLYALGGILGRVHMYNCNCTFSSLTGTNWEIAAGAIQESLLLNNVFSFPNVTTGQNFGVQSLTYILDSHITNNTFSFSSNTDVGAAVTVPLMWRVTISGNKFASCYRSIWAGSISCISTHINNNNFIDTGFSGIELDHSISTHVENNVMDAYSANPDGYMIYANNSWLGVYKGNSIQSFHTGTDRDGYMIRFHNNGLSNIIADNTLVNSVGVNSGFKYGIVLDGESGSHLYDSISRNKITFFNNIADKGMVINNTAFAAVENNLTVFTTAPLNTYNLIKSIISNNIFNIEGTETEPAITIDGNVSRSDLIISNNSVRALYPTNHLVEITSGSGDGYGVISGNNIGCFATPSVINCCDISASNYIISGNQFYGDTAGSILNSSGDNNAIISNQFSGIVLFYGAWSTGDYCFVSLNDFIPIDTTLVGDRLLVSGTRSTDTLNKGQTYSVVLPPSNGTLDDTSNWTRYVRSDHGVFFDGTNGNQGTANAEFLMFDFSNREIPTGSILSNAYIDVSHSTTDELEADLRVGTWDSEATTSLQLGYIGPNVDGIIIVWPLLQEIVTDEKRYTINVRASNNTHNGKQVNGAIRITYTL